MIHLPLDSFFPSCFTNLELLYGKCTIPISFKQATVELKRIDSCFLPLPLYSFFSSLYNHPKFFMLKSITYSFVMCSLSLSFLLPPFRVKKPRETFVKIFALINLCQRRTDWNASQSMRGKTQLHDMRSCSIHTDKVKMLMLMMMMVMNTNKKRGKDTEKDGPNEKQKRGWFEFSKALNQIPS